MKPRKDYQPRINRKRMREEGVAVLAVTALIETIAQIVIVSLQSRYGETIDLPWDTLRGAAVALASAVALALLAGERDKDQFDGMQTVAERFGGVLNESLKFFLEKLRDRFTTRV